MLPFTGLTARCFAGLHVPDPRSLHDSMIAVTALEHGFNSPTRNVDDVAGADMQLVNLYLGER